MDSHTPVDVSGKVSGGTDPANAPVTETVAEQPAESSTPKGKKRAVPVPQESSEDEMEEITPGTTTKRKPVKPPAKRGRVSDIEKALG